MTHSGKTYKFPFFFIQLVVGETAIESETPPRYGNGKMTILFYI